MEPAFSRPGEPPTVFEREMLSNIRFDHPTRVNQLWLMLAQRIGLGELMLILDELGDTDVWMPSRRGLMSSLWNEIRDKEILRLANAGASQSAIARHLKTSRRTVARVALPHGSAQVKREKQAR